MEQPWRLREKNTSESYATTTTESNAEKKTSSIEKSFLHISKRKQRINYWNLLHDNVKRGTKIVGFVSQTLFSNTDEIYFAVRRSELWSKFHIW